MSVSFILTFSAPLKTYTNGTSYLVRRQQDPSDHANAWIYDDNPSRPCFHHDPFYRQCPLCLKSIPAHGIIHLHTVRHIPHYICPQALIFYSPVVSVNALFVKIPICISTWTLPSSPAAPLPRRHHPACQPHDVRPHEELLDNYLLRNNHLYLLLNPIAINLLVLYFYF